MMLTVTMTKRMLRLMIMVKLDYDKVLSSLFVFRIHDRCHSCSVRCTLYRYGQKSVCCAYLFDSFVISILWNYVSTEQ